MNNMKNLCKAIIQSACFLERSPDDIINPDSAVKALVDIAAALLAATDEEKAAFRQTCVDEASRLEREAGPGCAEIAGFIRSLPASIGI